MLLDEMYRLCYVMAVFCRYCEATGEGRPSTSEKWCYVDCPVDCEV